MSLDADAIVDRRRMRRKLTFWRVSALLIALLALVGLAAALVPGGRLTAPGAYIARIKVEEIKSSPLKAAPNGFEPTSPEARAAIAAIVTDSYAWFKDLVKDRRQMSDAQLAAVADGRVFTGRQGVGLKLVDSLGNEKTALAWLEKEKKVPASTPVRDYSLEPRFSELSFLHVAAWTFEAVGLNAIAHRIEGPGAVQAIERLNLDGLLALWHPPSAN